MDDSMMEVITKLFCQTMTEVVHRPALQEAVDSDLTEVQIACMRHVYLHQLPSIGEIADGLGISNAAATKLVNRLVIKEWVERNEDPKDRRVLQMRLTSAGERLIERIRQRETFNFTEILSRMDGEQVKNLRQGMEGFLTTALNQKEWVDRVCLRCGWSHQVDCLGNLISKRITGNDKKDV